MLILDSRNRIMGSNTDFTIFFNDSFLDHDGDYLLGLDECIIPNLIYPIRSGRNQVIFYENNDSKNAFTATIPTGNYDATSFATALKTAMDTAGANTYTVSISSITKRITVASAPDNFRFANILMTPAMNRILGYFSNEIMLFDTTQIGSLPVRLDGDEYLLLQMDTISNDNLVSQVPTRGILDVIPLNVGFGNIVYHQANSDNDYTPLRATQLNNVRIRLLNPDGQPVELPDNCPCQFKFRVVSLY
jgi:hypothetical protein